MDENTIDFELKMSQKSLLTLYGDSLKVKNIDKKKSYPFSIYLGDISDLADGALNDRVLDMKKRIFKRLQEEGVVAKFTGPSWISECPGDDECNQNCYITGEYYPAKVLPFLEKIWEPRRKSIKEFVSLYRKLITLIKKYFKQQPDNDNPEIEKYNLEANKHFRLLSKELKDLFQDIDSSLVKVDKEFINGPYIPFASLFSALKELRQKRTTPKEAQINMVAFYGKLKEIEESFDIENYKNKRFNADEFFKHIDTSIDSDDQSSSQPRINHKKLLIETPTGTKWSDISIRWLDGNDVEITLRNDPLFKKTKDYKELGFYDEKRKCPNIQWRILENASRYGKKLSWANLGGISDAERHKKIDNFQKQISLLRKELINVFGNLVGDKNAPFISFSKDMEYLITLSLIPEKGAKAKKKESWKDMLSEAEINNYEQIAKKDFIKNMKKQGYETSSNDN